MSAGLERPAPSIDRQFLVRKLEAASSSINILGVLRLGLALATSLARRSG
jgi:hypothetical protein